MAGTSETSSGNGRVVEKIYYINDYQLSDKPLLLNDICEVTIVPYYCCG
jgi:hypothetical protein